MAESVRALPPMPQTLMRVWQVIDNPASDSRTLTHAEIGVMLAEAWKLPPSLQDVIRHHAHPRHETGRELEVLVNLACTLADQQEYCQCGDTEQQFEASRKFLRLNSSQLNLAREVVMSRLVQLAEAFELAA